MVVGKRDQGQETRTLDGGRELTLITGVGTSNTRRNNLAGLGHKIFQRVDVFVIDLLNAFSRKTADALALKECRLCGATGTLVLVKLFMTPLSEFQKNNGNESINKNGNEKEESVDESRDFLNATQTSDDPFCGLEDKDFYSGANTFIDLVSQLNSKSNEEIQNELEDELEKHLEQFETVAEEDWCLPSNEIEMLTDKIVSGELVFHYSSDGNSYLTDSGTVIYPEFMARKNVTNAL